MVSPGDHFQPGPPSSLSGLQITLEISSLDRDIHRYVETAVSKPRRHISTLQLLCMLCHNHTNSFSLFLSLSFSLSLSLFPFGFTVCSFELHGACSHLPFPRSPSHPFVRSYVHPFIRSSLHPFISSSLGCFCSSSLLGFSGQTSVLPQSFTS